VGIFGGSPQDQVDLDHVNDRLARLEAAVASLQGQLAALTDAAVAAGGAVPYAGNPNTVSDGALPAGGEWMTEVRSLKASGNLIQAIKVYREHTGLGLKESKDAVEGMD
jgi:large subunit ribosomal protein L7/L12